jgi:hypothetical protein
VKLDNLESGMRRMVAVKLGLLRWEMVEPKKLVLADKGEPLKLTGVLSSSTSSVADVAASIRSSHLLPYAADSPLEGSAEKALRS